MRIANKEKVTKIYSFSKLVYDIIQSMDGGCFRTSKASAG